METTVFETQLRPALDDAVAAGKITESDAKPIYDVLDSRPSRKRDRRLRRMERHVAAHLDQDHVIEGSAVYTSAGLNIDWSKIDWKKVIGVVVQLLLKVLPLLLVVMILVLPLFLLALSA